MSQQVNIEEVKRFFTQWEQESGVCLQGRLSEVLAEIENTGTYWQTTEELEWAAKLAWRNSDRCIGRLPWKTLQTLDFRHLTTAKDVFQACVQHIQLATNNGKIKPYVSVFHPDLEIRFLNKQLILYAGYQLDSGEILGDPAQLELTKLAISLGWNPPAIKTQFDLLPIIIDCAGEERQFFELDPQDILEVPLQHSDHAWFAEMNLKWFALPIVSNKSFLAGGIEYTAAPFSGYYMGTEIGARNLVDKNRYNLLPLIADKLGLDKSKGEHLWKDRALIEINEAVLYSFRKAGVTIIDHHSASRQFMKHLENEEKCGRETPANWSWIVPPISGSACPVFHRGYSTKKPAPKFAEKHTKCPFSS